MPESPFDPEFDALVTKLLDEWKVPGLSIAVVHGDETYSKVVHDPRYYCEFIDR
jgi:hypothetical protein